MHFRNFGFLSLAFICGLSACGYSSSDDSSREFGKAIDQVNYSLSSTKLRIMLGAGSGTIQDLNSNINYLPNKSKDKILRRIDGSNFKLQVNGTDALIPVSSRENISHEQQFSENFQSCRLIGTSKVEGAATSLRLNLNWNLFLKLEGDSCDAFVPKYQAILQSELARFNLTVVKDVLNSTDLTVEDQREININLDLSGESN